MNLLSTPDHSAREAAKKALLLVAWVIFFHKNLFVCLIVWGTIYLFFLVYSDSVVFVCYFLSLSLFDDFLAPT